jgi:hypothetical protein
MRHHQPPQTSQENRQPCHGPPCVGKALSARTYSRWDKVKQSDLWGSGPTESPLLDTVFYSPDVVNAPGGIASCIRFLRDTLQDLAGRPLRVERQQQSELIRQRDRNHQRALLDINDGLIEPLPELHPAAGEVAKEYNIKYVRLPDPTTLIDEADRPRTGSLEQVRAIFYASEIGVVLIGMPGLEKRLARYAQFYSRIGFVHEFRPLGTAEIRRLQAQRWAPAGVHLPEQPWAEDATAAIIRITGGNFRLLNRLLTQTERILKINSLREVNKEVVDAARESLVIGQA